MKERKELSNLLVGISFMGLIAPLKSQQNLPLQQKNQQKTQLKYQLKIRQDKEKAAEDSHQLLILETHAGLKVKLLHHKSLSLEPLAESLQHPSQFCLLCFSDKAEII